MKPIRIIIAPDSYKHSIDAFTSSSVIAEVIKSEINCNIEILPIGDGGDGTAEIMGKALGAECVNISTYDPLERDILSPVWIMADKAIVEMADVSGLRLLEDNEKDADNASSGGFGLLIKRLIDRGIKHLILCIGGSATIDMGYAALKELGVKFLDNNSNDLKDIPVSSFHNINDIDLSGVEYIKDIKIDILCDVNNPLLGENGAIRVYGPQKGVLPSQVDELSDCHKHLSEIIYKRTGKDISDMQYSGAAGGISAGFHALLGANLYNGSDYILDMLDFDRKIKNCDILITGEGCMDYQSQYGKAPYKIAERSRSFCNKIIAVNGKTDYLPPVFDISFSLLDYASSLDDSILNAHQYLKILSKDIIKYLKQVI